MDDVLLITGSMGAGKTATLGEASDLLTARGIAHAAVDLDLLGLAHVPDASSGRGLALRNLAAVCANFAAARIVRLLIAAAVESRDELDGIREATSARRLVVGRLRAPLATMEARVAARERGVERERYVARVEILERILDAVTLEAFTIDTNASITDVAMELLRRAHWIDGCAPAGLKPDGSGR
jgi:hypothetical protein